MNFRYWDLFYHKGLVSQQTKVYGISSKEYLLEVNDPSNRLDNQQLSYRLICQAGSRRVPTVRFRAEYHSDQPGAYSRLFVPVLPR